MLMHRSVRRFRTQDGYRHTAVRCRALPVFLRIFVNQLLEPFAVEGAEPAVDHQRIIQPRREGRFIFRRIAEIPQRTDIHHNMPGTGRFVLDHQQVADLQRVLQLVIGQHLIPFPGIIDMIPAQLPQRHHIGKGGMGLPSAGLVHMPGKARTVQAVEVSFPRLEVS